MDAQREQIKNMSLLLRPLSVGDLYLRNRIIMAPLTRCRASGADGRTPNALMAQYYLQRADAGLIITEATAISPMGVGYPDTPGIWSTDHIEGWRKITRAVRARGGKMFLQLWHVGRVSHPLYLKGQLPVAPSSMAPDGYVSRVRPPVPFVPPRALLTEEIPQLVRQYKEAAENAMKAEFDGVEIHGANGYLIDQFLQSGSNHRIDQYGGCIENRARFMMEVTDAIISVWGPQRVGMHLAPRRDSHCMSDATPFSTFSYVAEQLAQRKIAFICAREYEAVDSLGPGIRKLFNGIYIGNEKFTLASAEAALERGDVDAVAFGKDFIATPDLAKRIAMGKKWNTPRPETYYEKGKNGYIDYPFLDE